jgi:hypothetical protein
MSPSDGGPLESLSIARHRSCLGRCHLSQELDFDPGKCTLPRFKSKHVCSEKGRGRSYHAGEKARDPYRVRLSRTVGDVLKRVTSALGIKRVVAANAMQPPLTGGSFFPTGDLRAD